MAFNQKYLWKVNNTVVIKHCEGKHIRVNEGKLGNDRSHCKIKSNKTGKYMRIHKPGGNLAADCGGTGGEWCVAKVHINGDVVKLEFTKAGKYLAVKNGQVTYGAGGPFCKLNFFR